jgi:hypothetical protein
MARFKVRGDPDVRIFDLEAPFLSFSDITLLTHFIPLLIFMLLFNALFWV